MHGVQTSVHGKFRRFSYYKVKPLSFWGNLVTERCWTAMFSQNSVISLKRWLEFRGFQRKGTQTFVKSHCASCSRPEFAWESCAPGQAGGLCWSGG